MVLLKPSSYNLLSYTLKMLRPLADQLVNTESKPLHSKLNKIHDTLDSTLCCEKNKQLHGYYSFFEKKKKCLLNKYFSH